MPFTNPSPQTRRQRAALFLSAARERGLEGEISRVAQQSGFNVNTVRRGLTGR